jgi:hypothetical protein
MTLRRQDVNDALDELLREHEHRVRRHGRLPAVVVLVAAARLLLAELRLRERVKVERDVERLLP